MSKLYFGGYTAVTGVRSVIPLVPHEASWICYSSDARWTEDVEDVDFVLEGPKKSLNLSGKPCTTIDLGAAPPEARYLLVAAGDIAALFETSGHERTGDISTCHSESNHNRLLVGTTFYGPTPTIVIRGGAGEEWDNLLERVAQSAFLKDEGLYISQVRELTNLSHKDLLLKAADLHARGRLARHYTLFYTSNGEAVVAADTNRAVTRWALPSKIDEDNAYLKMGRAPIEWIED